MTTQEDGHYNVPLQNKEGAAPPFVIYSRPNSRKISEKDSDEKRTLQHVEDARKDSLLNERFAAGLYDHDDFLESDGTPLSSTKLGYGFDARITSKGSMEQDIFFDFTEHFVKHLAPDQGKGKKAHLLMLDSHASRWTVQGLVNLMSNNVWPIFIPSHTSHISQSNDNGCNKEFHRLIGKEFCSYCHFYNWNSLHTFNVTLKKAYGTFVENEHEKLRNEGKNIATSGYYVCGYKPFNPSSASWESSLKESNPFARDINEIFHKVHKGDNVDSLPNYEICFKTSSERTKPLTENDKNELCKDMNLRLITRRDESINCAFAKGRKSYKNGNNILMRKILNQKILVMIC